MSLKAGFARIPIPCPIGQELSGYGYFLERKCVGIMDTLYIRSVVLEQEQKKTVVVSADLIGLRQDIVSGARRLIREEFGISDDAIMIVCTHTHTGPATHQLYGCGVVDEKYLEGFASCILKAVKEAAADLGTVAKVVEVCESVEPIGYNRVLQAGCPHDAFVRGVLFTMEADDKEKQDIALVSYPCHPVTLGKLDVTSADYPGAFCARMEKHNIRAVFLNGCCGDIDPVSNLIAWGSGTQETIDGYATTLADGFLRGICANAQDMDANTGVTSADADTIVTGTDTVVTGSDTVVTGTDTVVTGGTEPVQSFAFDAVVPLLPLNDEVIGKGRVLGANKRVAENWAQLMKDHFTEEDVENIRVYGVKIGKTIFCAVPYEGFTRIGDEARALVQDKGLNVAVLGCGESTKSYLPDIAPGQEYTYAALDAAMLYEHRMYRADAAVSLGQQIGNALGNL